MMLRYFPIAEPGVLLATKLLSNMVTINQSQVSQLHKLYHMYKHIDHLSYCSIEWLKTITNMPDL